MRTYTLIFYLVLSFVSCGQSLEDDFLRRHPDVSLVVCDQTKGAIVSVTNVSGINLNDKAPRMMLKGLLIGPGFGGKNAPKYSNAIVFADLRKKPGTISASWISNGKFSYDGFVGLEVEKIKKIAKM